MFNIKNIFSMFDISFSNIFANKIVNFHLQIFRIISCVDIIVSILKMKYV